MPSTYAHYRFGMETAKKLPRKIQRIIIRQKEMYKIGLHGPDIFFYYKPLRLNEVNTVGYNLHGQPAIEFFEKAGKVINSLEGEEREKAMAYVFGFICHFALDSQCHGYIDKKIKCSGLSHTEIEVEFDSALMRRDGYHALWHKLTRHIVPSRENARIIQKFFPQITTKQVRTALISMIQYNNLLIAPGLIKRGIVSGILKVSGNYSEMHGLLVNRKPNVKCRDSNKMLMRLYRRAEKEAEKLIPEYYIDLSGHESFSSKFNHTFGAD